MAQAGFTPISLYHSSTAAAAPLAANLANGELAINIADGKLYYKDNLGVVKSISGATATYTRTSFTATAAQTTFTVTYAVGFVQVYLNGVFLNGTDFTATNGTTVVLATGATAGDIVETVAYNIANIGTASTATNLAGGIASQIPYQTGAGATAFIANGTSGQALVSNGTSAPSFGTLSITGGGTGQTTATAAFNALNPMTTTGDIIYEASSTVAARLPIGTTGQVLTVSGGIPAWATPSAGAMTLISTQTASASADLSWTGLSGYSKYCVILQNLLPATSDEILSMQIGTGSTTYITSGYMRAQVYMSTATAVNALVSSSTSSLILGGQNGVTNGTSQGISGYYNITGFLASQRISLTGISQYQIAIGSSPREEIVTGGHNSNSTEKTAIKIFFGAGNITSGTASLYGITS